MSRTKRAVPHWVSWVKINNDPLYREHYNVPRNPIFNGRDRKPISYLYDSPHGWKEPLNGPKSRRYVKRSYHKYRRKTIDKFEVKLGLEDC